VSVSIHHYDQCIQNQPSVLGISSSAKARADKTSQDNANAVANMKVRTGLRVEHPGMEFCKTSRTQIVKNPEHAWILHNHWNFAFTFVLHV
jgi:hypothetical protein